MTVRAINKDGGIVTSGQQFISGSAEVGQTIVTRLRLFTTEYFRDLSEGTDWWNKVLGKGNDTGQADAVIRSRIAQTIGVTRIIEYNSDYDLNERKFSVFCRVQTIYGPTDIQYTGSV
jgi:hypothetical protein